MTAIDFVKWIQGYYAKYPQGQKKDIWEYLKDLNPSYLDALKVVLMKRYSSKWGRPPDIAIFEECKAEVMDNLVYKPMIEDMTEYNDLVKVDAADIIKKLINKAKTK